MLFNCRHNFFDILAETKMQHLVSFIEDGNFKVRKIEILPFDVVFDSSCGADEEINSAPKSIGLIIDGNATVNC